MSSLIIATGLAMSGYFISSGIIGFKRFDRIVAVRGLDERLVKSDQATWKIDYAVAGNELRLVTNETKRFDAGIREFVKAKSFQDENIQSLPITIVDSEAQEYSSRKGLRYLARGAVIITAADVDLITKSAEQTNDLLDKGIVITNSSVQYSFNGLNEIKPDMLKAATLSAKEAASSFAENAGAKLGKIKSAEQGLFSIGSPSSEYDATSSIMKKVRVVTNMVFYLE